MAKTVVKKFKGERALRSGIDAMTRRGYVVQSQGSRKKVFSLGLGLLTRKQIHTVTFVRAPKDS